MTRTIRNSGKAAMRAVGMLACTLSIVATLAGVARSGGSKQCEPSLACPIICDSSNPFSICLNTTNTTPVPVGVQKNITFIGAVCLKPGDKKALKAVRQQCEDLGEACCLEGDLEACPTSKPFNATDVTVVCRNKVFPGVTGIPDTCICQRQCPLGQRLWHCQLRPEDG